MRQYNVGIIADNKLVTIVAVSAKSEDHASALVFAWTDQDSRFKSVRPEDIELYHFGNPRHQVLFDSITTDLFNQERM